MQADQIDWQAIVRLHDQLVCSHMTSEPVALLKSLASAPPYGPFGVMLGVPFTMAAEKLPAHATLTTYGGMGSARVLARSRTLNINHTPYSQCEAQYLSGVQTSDVVLVSLSRAPDGRLYLGASHGYIIEAARRARVVVAEVNARAPCVLGSRWPDDIDLHHVIEVDYALAPELAEAAGDGTNEAAIAAHVAACVPDGACLQIGIGSLPSALLSALAGHRHLGVHSGAMTDAMLDLIQRGAIDHSRKPAGIRHAVIGSLYGSPALYDFAHLNEQVELRAPSHTHHSSTMVGLNHFVAINSAIEVDVMGRANAETVRANDGNLRYVGGVGGLHDMVQGAFASTGGRAIMALPSRTQNGPAGRPRIVAQLSGPVTVASEYADLVVTEHGVAQMKDRTASERVQQMLSIADPQDRDLLAAQAKALGF